MADKSKLISWAPIPDIIRLLEENQSEYYSRLCISVFDHWLNEDEAYSLLGEATKLAEDVWKNKFLNFYKIIFEHTSVFEINYSTLYSKKNECAFKKIDSQKNFINQFQKEDINRDMFRFVLPDLKAIYFENFDYTDVLFFKDESLISELRSWVEVSGLFVI